MGMGRNAAYTDQRFRYSDHQEHLTGVDKDKTKRSHRIRSGLVSPGEAEKTKSSNNPKAVDTSLIPEAVEDPDEDQDDNGGGSEFDNLFENPGEESGKEKSGSGTSGMSGSDDSDSDSDDDEPPAKRQKQDTAKDREHPNGNRRRQDMVKEKEPSKRVGRSTFATKSELMIDSSRPLLNINSRKRTMNG